MFVIGKSGNFIVGGNRSQGNLKLQCQNFREIMQTNIILCSRPETFGVEFQDNAYQEEGIVKWHAHPIYWSNRILSMWDSVVSEFTKRNIFLIKIKPKVGLYDQCFTADPVIMIIKNDGSRIVIPSHMNALNRQGEVAVAVSTLQKNGFTEYILHDFEYLKHEGAGDFLFLPGHEIYVQGYGPRSQSGFGQTLANELNQTVVELPLAVVATNKVQHSGMIASCKTHGYHIDTIVWPLPNKYLVGCFKRMPLETQAFFKALYPTDRCINLTEDEADLLVANGIMTPALPDEHSNNGHTLFIPDTTPFHIRDILTRWGFGLKAFDVEASKLAGAGLHCMFNYAFHENANPISKIPRINQNGVKYYLPKQ